MLAAGALPEGWAFHGAETLRERGREVLQRLAARRDSRREDWAVEGGSRRTNRLRGFMTWVKPAARALLVEWGEPVLETWRAPYPELVRRMRRYDEALAERLEAVLAALPPAAGEEEARAGALVLRLLEAMGERAEALGVLDLTPRPPLRPV